MPLSYTSVKLIQIENTKLALFHYITQALIFVYVVVFSIWLSKGYQAYGPAVGTTSVKMKGVANLGGYGTPEFELFDMHDLVVPAFEADAVFVTTNLVRTPRQQKGICHGFHSSELCSTGCAEGTPTEHGYMTGECDEESGYCLIEAWCPVEEDEPENYEILNGVHNWTALVKVNVQFPDFDVSLTNLFDEVVPGSNLYSIEEIVQGTGYEFQDVQERGAIILATIDYNCDLDNGSGDCVIPDIVFYRIDDPPPSVSPGFNYRYTENNGNGRDLVKAYGVRVVFHIFGEAGAFNIVPLLTNLGAGVALLSLATLISDLMLQYVVPAKDKYKSEKFQVVAAAEGDDLLLPTAKQERVQSDDVYDSFA